MATITYKCPNCGGGLVFDPETQKFKCEFCLSEFTQAELDKLQKAGASDQVIKEDYGTYDAPDEASAGQGGSAQGAGAQEKSAQGMVVYTCPSCGAEIVTEATTAATSCYYCHNPIVLEGRVSGKFLPDRIIPFQYNKKEATDRFLKYVRKKKYVPRAFFNEQQIEKLTGVYYPFWVYDCEVEGEIEGSGTKVRVWRSGNYEYTETSIYRIERGGKVHVQNVTRNALKEGDRNLIDAVRPFRIAEATDFSMPYLQGFVAEKRDIESEEVSEELQKTAHDYAVQAMVDTTGEYSSVTPSLDTLHPVKESWQYLLLPVWLLTYGASSGQNYYYAMNGQTGEIKGKLPLSMGKLAAHSAILGGCLAAACLLLSYFVL